MKRARKDAVVVAKIGKRWIAFLTLSLVLPLIAGAAEDVQVRATVDRNEVAPGETFTYTISVSSSGSVNAENPRLGDLDGLDLINSWSGQQTQSTYVNGTFKVQNSKTFNFMLAPQKAGQVKIPSAQVVVDGTSHTTDPITVSISDHPKPSGNAGNTAQQDPMLDQIDQMDQMFNQLLQRRFGGVQPRPLDDQSPVNPNEAFFIRAEADKATAYVGEQVTASWYIYTRGQITDIDTLRYPNLKGFWKEELEMATRLNFEQVVVNGIPYQRARLVAYALFPIKAGKTTIDSYTARCTVLTPGNFGFGRPYQFSKTSRPLQLNVIDVPKENRPSNFTGAVGDFRVTAELDRTTVPAHQPVTWKVRFSGRGNAKLIDLPAFELPPSVELYDQKSDSKFSKDGTSYKEFEILVIPRQEGVVQIPALSLSVFNPVKKAFEKIETKALSLTVTPGQKTGTLPDLAQTNTPQDQKSKVEALPFFTTPMSSFNGASSPLIWGGGLMGLSLLSMLVHALLALGRTRKKETLNKILNARSQKIHALIKKKDWRAVGAEITNGTYQILSKIADQNLPQQDLRSLLMAVPPSLRLEHGDALSKMISDAETLAFAPEEISRPLSDSQKLKQIFSEFQRVMKEAIQRTGDDE